MKLPRRRSSKTEFITLQDDCFDTIRLFKYLVNSNRISSLAILLVLMLIPALHVIGFIAYADQNFSRGLPVPDSRYVRWPMALSCYESTHRTK